MKFRAWDLSTQQCPVIAWYTFILPFAEERYHSAISLFVLLGLIYLICTERNISTYFKGK
jgi:hypothetical protein